MVLDDGITPQQERISIRHGKVSTIQNPKLFFHIAYHTLQLSDDIGDVLPQSLRHLDISNTVTSLPVSLSRLTTGLRSLNISKNNIQRCPEWLGGMTQLRRLQMTHCGFDELPQILGRLSSLTYLDLSRMQGRLGVLSGPPVVVGWLPLQEWNPRGKQYGWGKTVYCFDTD